MRGIRVMVAASVALLVGFFVLVVGTIAGLAGLAVYGLAGGYTTGGLKLLVVAGVLLFAVGAAAWKVWRAKAEPVGPRIERADQPELWAMVDELAAVAGTRGPDEIRMVPEVNAAVWERRRLLGLEGGPRYMMVGLPLLAGLNVSELRAVLAHELGHYGHGHTRLSALTYRATMTLRQTVSRMDGVFGWLFARYANLYARVSKGANRAQELQADLTSARAAGPLAARSALRKLAGLDEAWRFYEDRYVELSAQARRTPELLGGFRAFLADPTRQGQLAELEPALLDLEPESPYDSHPPIRVRLRALDAVADDGRERDDRPAWEVLRNPAETLPALEAELMVDGLGPRAPWGEIVQLAGAAAVRANAAAFAAAAVRCGAVRTGSIGELLDAMEAGAGLRIGRTMVDHEDAAEAAAQLMRDTAVAALVARDLAWHELDWGGPWRVRLIDGSELDPDAGAAQLRERLVALGLPLDDAPEPARTRAAAGYA